MTLVAGGLAVLVAAFVKGAVAFGFPLVATPLLALAFGAETAFGLAPRVSPRWERWLSPPVGLVAGVLGGLTNVPGTPLVLYFVALGMDKYELVRAIALSFIVVKLVQLGAVVWYGFLDLRLLAISLGLTLVALAGFAVGLRLQDWLPARAFNRAVLGVLVVIGVWLIVRSLWPAA